VDLCGNERLDALDCRWKDNHSYKTLQITTTLALTKRERERERERKTKRDRQKREAIMGASPTTPLTSPHLSL
jgi:hypothetical protein